MDIVCTLFICFDIYFSSLSRTKRPGPYRCKSLLSWREALLLHGVHTRVFSIFYAHLVFICPLRGSFFPACYLYKSFCSLLHLCFSYFCNFSAYRFILGCSIFFIFLFTFLLPVTIGHVPLLKPDANLFCKRMELLHLLYACVCVCVYVQQHVYVLTLVIWRGWRLDIYASFIYTKEHLVGSTMKLLQLSS